MSRNYEDRLRELFPLTLADGIAEAEGIEFSPEDQTTFGSLLICDRERNELRALILENLAGQSEKAVSDPPDLANSLKHLLEVGPFSFCFEHVQIGDLNRFISSPRFLREAHRRWVSEALFPLNVVSTTPETPKLKSGWQRADNLKTAAARKQEQRNQEQAARNPEQRNQEQAARKQEQRNQEQAACTQAFDPESVFTKEFCKELQAKIIKPMLGSDCPSIVNAARAKFDCAFGGGNYKPSMTAEPYVRKIVYHLCCDELMAFRAKSAVRGKKDTESSEPNGFVSIFDETGKMTWETVFDRADWISSVCETEELEEAAAKRKADVAKLLAVLSPEQIQVVRMKIWEDKKFKEIAFEIGIPLGTALSRFRTAMAKLKSCEYSKQCSAD